MPIMPVKFPGSSLDVIGVKPSTFALTIERCSSGINDCRLSCYVCRWR